MRFLVLLFTFILLSIYCGEPGRKSAEVAESFGAKALLYAMINQSINTTSDETSSEDTVESLPSGISGDSTNNTPSGAKCITDGTQNSCSSCDITSNVNTTRVGNIISMDDADWYCFDHQLSGSINYYTITTERSDSYYQPDPTDTYISWYDDFPGTLSDDFACTSYICNEPSGGAFKGRDDDGNPSPHDPTHTYSSLEFDLKNYTGVYYIRVGISTNRPGSYRVRLETRQ